MKIVIIEDEQLIADDLKEIIQEIDDSIDIVAQISTLKEGKEFFSQNQTMIDLIFSDIQLGDGLSFDLLKNQSIDTPVIFCTAFNEYAINAFKANGIDYVLKPFSTKTIKAALDRYKSLKSNFIGVTNELNFDEQIIGEELKSNVILVHHRDKIIPITPKEIAVVSIYNEQVLIYTFNGVSYTINKTLDELDNLLGKQFFRANRQNIVNKEVVKDVSTLINRKYLINTSIDLPNQIIVSKEKMTPFLNWLKE
ncbi:MAG: LytTR family DNA-binding domain-containing protein [Crocinitomicaceae bacterium]|nr:LytTR family DNA-binding domain-containing protein [Crocinitomicaceae bacterium]